MLRVIAAVVLMTMLTKGPGCKDFPKPELGDWTYPGPGGYAARFFDEGNLVGLTTGGPGSSERRPFRRSGWVRNGVWFARPGRKARTAADYKAAQS